MMDESVWSPKDVYKPLQQSIHHFPIYMTFYLYLNFFVKIVGICPIHRTTDMLLLTMANENGLPVSPVPILS
jgi:hypothetical protein